MKICQKWLPWWKLKLEVTFYVQSSSKFVRMIAFKIGKASLKMGHFGQKPRSLCQIIDKACLHSRSHIFCIIFIKLCRNIFTLTLSSETLLREKTLTKLRQFYLVSEFRPIMGLLLCFCSCDKSTCFQCIKKCFLVNWSSFNDAKSPSQDRFQQFCGTVY